MAIQISQNLAKKYSCKICDFNSMNKNDYFTHLETNKHKRLTNANFFSPNLAKIKFECSCGKVYKHKSSLSKHKKVCTSTQELIILALYLEKIQPDIVIFTNPHRLTKDEYYITNYRDTLTCYAPYAFVVIHSIVMHYNQIFHHLLWKHFVETKYHKEFAIRYAKADTSNIQITGYPSLDRIYALDYIPSIVWKEFPNKLAKRIIWAPHHSIEGQGDGLDYSSFVNYSKYFVELLESNNNIQMAFKPHPILKVKLYKDKDWGKEKTDAYFKKWDELPNGQLEEGDYIDLFFTSDAMILDSASFIVEYLYFDKPILFTMRDDNVKERFNSFGRMVFNYMYTAKNSVEVENFIQDTVVKKNDFLSTDRNQFMRDTILPESGRTASENIFNILKSELC